MYYQNSCTIIDFNNSRTIAGFPGIPSCWQPSYNVYSGWTDIFQKYIIYHIFLLNSLIFSKLTSTVILFSPYTASPGTMLRVTNASSFPRAIKTPACLCGSIITFLPPWKPVMQF